MVAAFGGAGGETAGPGEVLLVSLTTVIFSPDTDCVGGVFFAPAALMIGPATGPGAGDPAGPAWVRALPGGVEDITVDKPVIWVPTAWARLIWLKQAAISPIIAPENCS